MERGSYVALLLNMLFGTAIALKDAQVLQILESLCFPGISLVPPCHACMRYFALIGQCIRIHSCSGKD